MPQTLTCCLSCSFSALRPEHSSTISSNSRLRCRDSQPPSTSKASCSLCCSAVSLHSKSANYVVLHCGRCSPIWALGAHILPLTTIPRTAKPSNRDEMISCANQGPKGGICGTCCILDSRPAEIEMVECSASFLGPYLLCTVVVPSVQEGRT